MGFEDFGLMEYEGYVSQLAGGSEVATIGILITIQPAGYIELLNVYINVNDLAVGKTILAILQNTSGLGISNQSISLDNQILILSNHVLTGSTSTANNQGFNFPIVLGAGMSFKVQCTTTLDALKKITIGLLYKSRNSVIPTFTSIGAGITLTETSSIQI